MSSSDNSVFNVLFIGAGNIMFGSDEGPWNHSMRLERKLGRRFNLVAIIDPATERAASILHKKQQQHISDTSVPAYRSTLIFPALTDFLDHILTNSRARLKPHVVIIGCPPMFRGNTQPGHDVELQVLQAFPGVPIFVEKPIATGPEHEIVNLITVSEKVKQAKIVCSVGYMLRYLKAVRVMRKIINDNNLKVMSTIARFACAYEAIAKPDWWDKAKSGGPIIEQATHLCDLSRYFGGEIDTSSVNARTLEWDEPAGRLAKITIDERKVLPENRIPRVTAASWKYASGAVGTLTHIVALQGHDYSCEFEVFADGYALKLANPYVAPVLHIRRPGSDNETIMTFTDDDPFYSEISTFIDVIESSSAVNERSPRPEALGSHESGILSSYEDAVRTYQFTWAIRKASEQSRKRSTHRAAL